MMYILSDIVKKIDKLKKMAAFAAYCFPYGDDARFVDSVKRIGREYNAVSVERFGEGQAKVFYHIAMERSGAGFFADFNKLLAYLYFADQLALVPVVEFSRESMYAEEHPVNGTENPFEYYFEQPCGISLERMKEESAVIRSRRENVILANSLNQEKGGYTKTEEHLRQMGRIFRKYIRLNAIVKEKLHKDQERLGLEGRSLGVHVRGTDFKWNYNGHPILVRAEEYLDEAVREYEKGGYQRIFLATDDRSALKMFEEQFGERLCYYRDTVRDDGKESVMNSVSERENHHYLLGYEVLRDMYTLASCNGLVAGLSQVSYAARICRRGMADGYDSEIILDKGINYHKRYNCPNERRRMTDGR
jgi:hypothetical protein